MTVSTLNQNKRRFLRNFRSSESSGYVCRIKRTLIYRHSLSLSPMIITKLVNAIDLVCQNIVAGVLSHVYHSLPNL